MDESVGSELVDRLSELPESLIHDILSFLPIRDVVSTTLLSKRWEKLWALVPCLNFSDVICKDERLDSHRVRNFVNRALIFWKGSKLLKFIIDIEHHFDKSLAGDMDLWVRFAVESKVEELNIRLLYVSEEFDWEDAVLGSKKDVYWVPQCLNLCSSIRKLSLVGCNLRIHGFPTWTQLKSLRIDGFCFSERLINRILLGAPQLEEFEVRLLESNENLNIQSMSLKKLRVDKYLYFYDDQPSRDTVLTICCPNLEALEISGLLYRKCLFTNVSSLTDATLVFDVSKCYGTLGMILAGGGTMRDIFSTFQHVERLTLSASSFKVIAASQKQKLFSPLPNVVFLKVVTYLFGLVEMVNLLEIFPNLQMLVIEDPDSQRFRYIFAENCLDFETNLSKSFLLQLKIVEITSCFSRSSIFRCIELLLKHGSVLEKLVIWTNWILPGSEAKLLEVEKKLLSMPRSSPTLKVIFSSK